MPTSASFSESSSNASATRSTRRRTERRRFGSCSRTPPSLVILDVTMPELDGYQTLERIRDLSDVPVLMLTARAQELEKVRGLSAGADDYVAKPFGRQELLARVQALLRRSGGKSEVIEAYTRRLHAGRLRPAAGESAGPRRAADAARVQAAVGLRAEPEPGALARPASGARVGRSLRRIAAIR